MPKAKDTLFLCFLGFMFIYSFHLSISSYPTPQSSSGPILLPGSLLLGCGYCRMLIPECLKKCQHALLHAGRSHFGRRVSLVSKREARAIHRVGSFDFGACPPHFRPHRRSLCNQTLLVLDLKGAPDIYNRNTVLRTRFGFGQFYISVLWNYEGCVWYL